MKVAQPLGQRTDLVGRMSPFEGSATMMSDDRSVTEDSQFSSSV